MNENVTRVLLHEADDIRVLFFYLAAFRLETGILKTTFSRKVSCVSNLITLGLLDISAWLAFVTITLLLTSEIVASYGPSRGLLIDRNRLRVMATTTGMLILGLTILRVLQLLGH